MRLCTSSGDGGALEEIVKGDDLAWETVCAHACDGRGLLHQLSECGGFLWGRLSQIP